MFRSDGVTVAVYKYVVYNFDFFLKPYFSCIMLNKDLAWTVKIFIPAKLNIWEGLSFDPQSAIILGRSLPQLKSSE